MNRIINFCWNFKQNTFPKKELKYYSKSSNNILIKNAILKQRYKDEFMPKQKSNLDYKYNYFYAITKSDISKLPNNLYEDTNEDNNYNFKLLLLIANIFITYKIIKKIF